MTLFTILIVLILIGFILILRYNKLPHPIVIFLTVFGVMSLIYTMVWIISIFPET